MTQDRATLSKGKVGVRIFIGAIVALFLALFLQFKEGVPMDTHIQAWLSSLFFGLLIAVISGWYFIVFHEEVVADTLRLALYATIILLTLGLAKLTEFLLIHSARLSDALHYPLFVPFAACLMAVFLGRGVALFTTCFLSVILGLGLHVDHSPCLVINLLTGVVALLTSHGMRRRKEVFGIMGSVWGFAVLILVGFHLIDHTLWSLTLVSDILISAIFLFASAVLIVGLLPVFESLFHIMTDMTLMEYMDPNSELLKRLSLEVPGTYQHSLVVGTLAETAASAIGANGLFCRVATLYHDIGKLFNPHYFTENQLGGFNIHELLTPLESAQVIVAHVAEGEELARKYSLPQSFIDIIREHHGTTLVYYFYCKQVEQMGGNTNLVEEEPFRYPGPKPHTKESAIIMIADTVEATSRSLDNVTEDSLRAVVNQRILERVNEGQFDECQLTFEDLGKVKEAMIKTLAVTRHLRVKYPDRKPPNVASKTPAAST